MCKLRPNFGHPETPYKQITFEATIRIQTAKVEVHYKDERITIDGNPTEDPFKMVFIMPKRPGTVL